MEPGRFRHRVTIQNFTTIRDEFGQEIEEWFDIDTVSAETKGISGRELISAGAEMAEATIRVWMRHRSDVTASSRLLCRAGPYQGIVLDIIGQPIPNAKCTRLEIFCKQGVKR
ncbi:head-tail adaptor protein [Limnobaculum zhutongyuii]|uniref:Head-tail adaptor protein n=1 Tax=Limnobaculum zhutongyuii TaxID=2498113 RepID=A0A411WLP1_9GAMM|nr:phage head closure protein [Limnobaculum zhutongyuii]QBH97161.1 head-tail adaptor protein [Limnobaculum zhutongyuii]TQS88420.1 head-tail adaptor protein [Limnobaculum zhutongyuii]